MNIIKKQYKDICLVLGYIFMAELVYVTLAIKFLHEWYFGLLAGILVFLIGSVIGFFYVRSEYKNRLKKEEKIQSENVAQADTSEEATKKEGE